MKELSIEEKARRYDEVIERANSLLSGNQLGNAWIYKLFPELRESEDEKIRKELIEFVKAVVVLNKNILLGLKSNAGILIVALALNIMAMFGECAQEITELIFC